MMAGSETETVGVTEKLKETADSEAETMAGTESGADTDAGIDSESRVDRSGAVAGAEASTRCAIASGRRDAGADLRSTVVGTATGDKAAAVAWTEVRTISETIPSAFAVASKFAAAANARLGSARTETEQVG